MLCAALVHVIPGRSGEAAWAIGSGSTRSSKLIFCAKRIFEIEKRGAAQVHNFVRNDLAVLTTASKPYTAGRLRS